MKKKKNLLTERNWNHPPSWISHFELFTCIPFYLKPVKIGELLVRKKLDQSINGCIGSKKSSKCAIPREMNTGKVISASTIGSYQLMTTLGKVAKFCGHGLNCLAVCQLFRNGRGLQKPPPHPPHSFPQV